MANPLWSTPVVCRCCCLVGPSRCLHRLNHRIDQEPIENNKELLLVRRHPIDQKSIDHFGECHGGGSSQKHFEVVRNKINFHYLLDGAQGVNSSITTGAVL